MKKDPSFSNLSITVLTISALVIGYYLFAIIFERAKIPAESVPGALFFGITLLLYLGWFVLDTYVTEEDFTWPQALGENLKSNPAFWAAYCFYLIFGFAVVQAVV